MSIKVSLIGEEKLKAKLELLGKPHPDLVKTMTSLADRLLARVQKEKLSGQVLNVRTGRLRRSITRSVEVTPEQIESIVGTNVEYARIHEYGGTINTLKRSFKMPERSFLRSALAEMKDYSEQSLSATLKRIAKS